MTNKRPPEYQIKSPVIRHWPWTVLRRWEGISGGETPCVSNTGVLVTVLFSMWLAGDSIDYLAEQYNFHPKTLEQAFKEWAGRPRNWKQRVEVRPNFTRRSRKAKR